MNVVQSEVNTISTKPSVLIVDDEDSFRRALTRTIKGMGWVVIEATGVSDGLNQLASHDVDVALVDLDLPGGSGHDVLRGAPGESVTDFVMLTGRGNPHHATAWLDAGASDYITKPVDKGRLKKVLDQALHRKQLRRSDPQKNEDAIEDFLDGHSDAMRKLRAQIRLYGRSNAPVMIYGESGTGKDRVARALHQVSGRSGPFRAINCGSLAETMIEGELFGWRKGSFTGAVSDYAGKLAMAAGGTLLLDEIGDMPLSFQVKILRAVEDGEYLPVGSNEPVQLTARLLGATHRDLEEGARDGSFRHDLRYRLNVAPLRIPPLRARVEDIGPLAWRFVNELNVDERRRVERISDGALKAMEAYQWPGNVRELRNALNRAILHAQGDTLTAEMLPLDVQAATTTPQRVRIDDADLFPARFFDLPYNEARDASRRWFVASYLEKHLNDNDGVVARAARAAGMAAPNFHRLMRSHGITSSRGGRRTRKGERAG